MNWILRTVNSSIGKKFLMAISGLGLCGFLVAHLTGNFLLFVGEEAFMAYTEALTSNKALLYTAEGGLIFMFLLHLVNALKLTAENKEARPIGYDVNQTAGASTVASRYMFHTGVIVFIFLILHIITFKFGTPPGQNLYENVITRFSNTYYSLFYVLCVVLLGIHVSHGLQSTFQTLGFNHKKYTGMIKSISLFFGIVIAAGFSSFPLYFMMKGGPS